MTRDVNFDASIRTSPDLLLREIEGEAVLLDLKTGRYLGLNQDGTFMWGILVRAGSIQSAYEQLLEEYEVEPERLHDDLSDFLRRLEELGFVTIEVR